MAEHWVNRSINKVGDLFTKSGLQAYDAENSRRVYVFSLVQTILMGLAFSLLVVLFVNYFSNRQLEYERQQQRINLIRLTSLALNAIEPDLAEIRSGKITRAEGLNRIEEKLSHMTFLDEDNPNYIFMGSYSGELYVQPYQPELVGTNQWDLQDQNGVYIIRELVRAAHSSPKGGFVSYYYPTPGSNKPQEKMSYVIGVPELQAFMGAGLYMDVYIQQQIATFNILRAFVLTFIGIITLASLLTIYRMNRQRKILQDEYEKRKKAQEAVERSENNLLTVFNGVSDAIVIHDLDGKILEVNQRMLELFGVSREQALGMRTFDAFPTDPLIVDDIKEAILQVDGGEDLMREFTIRSPFTHQYYEVEAGLRSTIWNGERAIVAMIRDITARKKIEKALAVSEARFHAAVDNIPFDLSVLDPRTKEVLFRNESALRNLTDYQNPQLDFSFADYWQKVNEHIQTNRIYRDEINLLESGKSKDIYHVVAPVYLKGELDQVLSIHIDITERKESEKKILYALEKLDGLHQIDVQIIARNALEKIFETVIEQAVKILHGDLVNVLLLNPKTGQLERVAHYGGEQDVTHCTSPIGSECLPWQVMRLRRSMSASTQPNKLPMCQHFAENGFRSFYGTPIITNGKIMGVIEVYLRTEQAKDPEWMYYLEALAGQAAIAVDNASLIRDLENSYRELNEAYEATISGWANALELRDNETRGHSERVMGLSCELAQALGFTETEMVHFRRGVLLHDIGKMGVPDHILLKPGPLDDEEWVVMKKHPEMAYRMLASIDYLKDSLAVPYSHHERWDGSGYPAGLKGEEIPLAARIFAVVDVWDALISDRPYRKGWAPDAIVDYLRENAGVQFDPRIVEKFLALQVIQDVAVSAAAIR